MYNMDAINKKILSRKIDQEDTLLFALKHMDANKVKLLLVFDRETFFGILTIGDIQRAIIKNTALTTPIKKILSHDKVYASPDSPISYIKDKIFEFKAECMPVIDEQNNLINIYFWEDFFPGLQHWNNRQLALPVIIMAGGKGERLKPLTNVIPKPLLPIKEKTILEIIMDKFEEVGCNHFFLSVNYKADIIKYYMQTLSKQYVISYIEESMPLGTIGSISLLKGKVKSSFFVSNCDIIIDQNYCDVYDYHRNNKNEITIIAALKHYHIPYGVLDVRDEGVMVALNEKPELTFMVNTGVYILEPHLIEEIPVNTFYHITHLIEKVKDRKGKIGVFPVSEGSWHDIGNWKEYQTISLKT